MHHHKPLAVGLLAASLALLSACSANVDADVEKSRIAAGTAGDYNVSTPLEDCEHQIAIWAVPREQLDAYLAERAPGWRASAYEEWVSPSATAGLRLESAAPSPMGTVIALFHPCGAAMGGVAEDFWFFWISIDPVDAAESLDEANYHYYQVRQAGDGGNLDRVVRNAIGDSIWTGRTVTTGIYGDEDQGYSGHSELQVDGKPVFSLDISNARVLPGARLHGLVNLYTREPHGLMMMQTGYADGSPDVYQGSGSCWMDPEHPLVEVLGTTECADPMLSPTFFLQLTHTHDVDLQVVWDRGWDGGAIVVVETTPWQDHD